MQKDKKTSENLKNIGNVYELSCLMGLHEEERVTQMASKIDGWVAKLEGELVEAEKGGEEKNKQEKNAFWVEKRRLAYPVKKGKFGYYLSFWLKILPEKIADLQNLLKLDNNIVRFQIIKEKNGLNVVPLRNAVPITEIKSLGLIPERQFYPQNEISLERKEEKSYPKREVKIKEEKTFLGAPAQEKIDKPVMEKKKTAKSIEAPLLSIADLADKPAMVEIKGKEEKILADRQEKEKKKPEQTIKETKKSKKISLEDLDKRLDDILNEEII